MIGGMALEFPEGLRSEVDADLDLALKVLPEPTGRLTGTVTVVRGSYREPLAVVTGLLAGMRAQRLAVGAADTSSPLLEALALDVAPAHRRGHHRQQQLRAIPAWRRPSARGHGRGAVGHRPRRTSRGRPAVRRPERLHDHVRHDRFRQPGDDRARPEHPGHHASGRRGDRGVAVGSGRESDPDAELAVESGTHGGRPRVAAAHRTAVRRAGARRRGLRRDAGARESLRRGARVRRPRHWPRHDSPRRPRDHDAAGGSDRGCGAGRSDDAADVWQEHRRRTWS